MSGEKTCRGMRPETAMLRPVRLPRQAILPVMRPTSEVGVRHHEAGLLPRRRSRRRRRPTSRLLHRHRGGGRRIVAAQRAEMPTHARRRVEAFASSNRPYRAAARRREIAHAG